MIQSASATSDQRDVIVVTGADLAAQAVVLLSNFNLVFSGKHYRESDLIALGEQYNPVAILLRYGSVSEAVMAAAPRLKIIAKHGTGTDTIDKIAAAKREIVVVAAPGANAVAVSEHALTLLLACAKSVVQLNARMASGHWDKATHKSMELSGKTIGIIGLGAIGLRMAKLCAALDMTVLGYDPYASQLPSFINQVDLPEIWRRSQAISLHCPLTPLTKHIINADSLASCRKGLLLINTARGGLTDEPALLAAVQAGHVAMAGIDSFAEEPVVPLHLFAGRDGFILSPHIGGVTNEAYINMGVAAATNILSHFNSAAALKTSPY